MTEGKSESVICERVACAELVERQTVEDRLAVAGPHGERPAQGGAGGVVRQRDGHGATVLGVHAALDILGRDDDPERVSDDDVARGLCGHDHLGGGPVGDQVGDQQVGLRAAQPGDLVVAGPGLEPAVAAAGDVVEIVAGDGIEGRQRLAGAVEARCPRQHAPLIGDGEQARPNWAPRRSCRRSGARRCRPGSRRTSRRPPRPCWGRRPRRRRGWSACRCSGRRPGRPARSRTGSYRRRCRTRRSRSAMVLFALRSSVVPPAATTLGE